MQFTLVCFKWFMLVVCWMTMGMVVQDNALADHSHVEFPFDNLDTNGWSSSDLSPNSPFGGLYLGTFDVGDTVTLFILDALPTSPGGDSSRPVNLSFDLVGFDVAIENFQVFGEAGSLPFSVELNSSHQTGGMSPNYSFALEFPLAANPLQLPTDLSISFQKTAGTSDWGLDNVVVDWSVPKVLFGDVNMDGVVDLLDVAPFVDLLSSGGYQVEADINMDGEFNLLDVAPFVDILTGP